MRPNVRAVDDSLSHPSPSEPLDVDLPVMASPMIRSVEVSPVDAERPRRTSLWVVLGVTVVLTLLKLFG